MNHLSDNTLKLLDLPREARALACTREIFLMHPTAMAAELSAKRLVELPRCTSNPGMTLKAHPGLGKSLLGQRWQTQSSMPKTDWAGKVIYIDLTENIANLNIMKLFLAEVGKKFHKRPLTLSYRDVVLAQNLIRENNIRAVFVDEVSLLHQSLTEKRLNREHGAIKGLAGPDWKMNVILSGTPDGLNDVFMEDATLLTRFNLRTAELSGWKPNYEGESFVKGYLCYMPLLQQSVINDEFLKALHDATLTTITVKHVQEQYCSRRAVADVLREACRMAVESGQEYINAESIRNARNSMQGINAALARLETRKMPPPEAGVSG